jgi:hypothetical protein
MNDLTVLKKKLSTYRSAKGQIRNVPSETLGELLQAWETWPGSSKEFYSALGFSRTQLAGVIGKAKRLKREGHFPAEEFQEMQLSGTAAAFGGGSAPGCGGSGIELGLSEGKIIRFVHRHSAPH